MDIKNLKTKVVRNLPTILLGTAVVAVVIGSVVVFRNAEIDMRNLPNIDEINQRLADGTASMLQDADGSIHVFW